MTQKDVIFLRSHVLYLFNMVCYPHTAEVRPWTDGQAKPHGDDSVMYSTWNPKINFMK